MEFNMKVTDRDTGISIMKVLRELGVITNWGYTDNDTGDDTPAPDAPYEMLGKIIIEEDEECLYANILEDDWFPARAYGDAPEQELNFRRLLHEHSFVTEAVGILKYIKNHLDQGEDYSIESSSIAYDKLDAILARLNAGPEKGV